MNNSNKYLSILLIALGSFIGFVVVIVVIFFLLKLASVVLFNIPGFESVYKYFITIIPYLLFLAAYFYLRSRIVLCKNKISRTIAMVFLIAAILVCFISFALINLKFFGLKKEWLNSFDDNSHYFLILQLILTFFATGALATGDPKEKDWMEKNKESNQD
ncbi:MAG: hypothetical protein WDM71_07950 [Ferruginibacter sp.]